MVGICTRLLRPLALQHGVHKNKPYFDYVYFLYKYHIFSMLQDTSHT